MSANNDDTTILEKYPDRIPIIMKPGDRYVWRLRTNKFLVPRDLTVSEFVYMIRRKMTLKPEQALYMSLEDGRMIQCSQLMSQLYDAHKNEDDKQRGLIILYFTENTFGYLNL